MLKAGADIIAPSGMMDGMVKAIRNGLDDAGFQDIPILTLRGEVRERVLRSVPRRRGKPAAIWRPQHLSNGPGQRRRSDERSRH